MKKAPNTTLRSIVSFFKEKKSSRIIIATIAIVGFITLTYSQAASNFISLETDSGTRSGVSVQSDPSASGNSYIQFSDGQAANPGQRGPTGRWPGHTPTYDTPADVVVTSYWALQQEINNGFSGKVIEVNIGPTSDSVTVNGGNTSWQQNILVRPPIGQRGDKFVFTGGSKFLEASHVTFAGMTLHGGFFDVRQGNRTTFAWTEMPGVPWVQVTNQPNFEWWEASHTGPTFSQSNADLMHVKAQAPGRVSGAYLTGIYLNGNPINWKLHNTPDYDFHADVFQTFVTNGGKIGPITIENSVLVSAADKSLQLANLSEDFVINNSYISGAATARGNWPKSQWYPWPDYDYSNNNYAITGPGGSQDYIIIRNSDIAGALNTGNYPGDPIKEATNSRFKAFLQGANTENDVTIDAAYNGPPPARPTPAQLDTIWSP